MRGLTAAERQWLSMPKGTEWSEFPDDVIDEMVRVGRLSYGGVDSEGFHLYPTADLGHLALRVCPGDE